MKAILKTATNGKKAVDICSEEMPEIIFMDVNMPIMGGYEATKLIKQLGGQTKVVAVTGDSEAQIKEQATEAGMDLILEKPVHINKLKMILDTLFKN